MRSVIARSLVSPRSFTTASSPNTTKGLKEAVDLRQTMEYYGTLLACVEEENYLMERSSR
ncbi:hypothetical protein AALP_AA3G096800 [Arabis alpina]|uniref:Uncharacterized protein n=1 Tax=Arabis alpina TaxID=50452 RepID=A0A087H853_ARAAL|nr:hypothetical protein AALP_AA3G096800 [Arabis alpina]